MTWAPRLRTPRFVEDPARKINPVRNRLMHAVDEKISGDGGDFVERFLARDFDFPSHVGTYEGRSRVALGSRGSGPESFVESHEADQKSIECRRSFRCTDARLDLDVEPQAPHVLNRDVEAVNRRPQAPKLCSLVSIAEHTGDFGRHALAQECFETESTIFAEASIQTRPGRTFACGQQCQR